MNIYEKFTELIRVTGGIPHKLYHVERIDSNNDYDQSRETPVTDIELANTMSSELIDDMHAPVLDIDIPGEWIESSTPGHHHLYLNVEIPWELYAELLTVMGKCGILEPGYVQASLARKGTFVRLPWVKKESDSEHHGWNSKRTCWQD